MKPAPPKAGEAQAATSRRQAGSRRRAPIRAHRRDARRPHRCLEGVKPGETVVTEGQIKLLPDARVVIDPKARLPPPANAEAVSAKRS